MKSQYMRDEPHHADTPIATTKSPLATMTTIRCDEKFLHQQYEILPGLWVHLDPNSIITKTSLTSSSSEADNNGASSNHCSSFGLLIKSDVITLTVEEYEDPIPLVRMTNVALSANVISGGTITTTNPIINDLSVNIDHTIINPLAVSNRLKRFLERYGRARSKSPSSSRDNDDRQYDDDDVEGYDIALPKAQVHAMKLTILNTITILFPHCVGTPTCTIRVLIEYYVRSLLRAIEKPSKKKPYRLGPDRPYKFGDFTSRLFS